MRVSVVTADVYNTISYKNQYVEKVFSATFSEHEKCCFEIISAFFVALVPTFQTRPFGSKHVKKYASQVHFEVVNNLLKVWKVYSFLQAYEESKICPLLDIHIVMGVIFLLFKSFHRLSNAPGSYIFWDILCNGCYLKDKNLKYKNDVYSTSNSIFLCPRISLKKKSAPNL